MVSKRIESIQSKPPVLINLPHRYYGLDKLNTFYRKLKSQKAHEQFFGAYDPNYTGPYLPESYYNLNTQGNIKVVVVGDGATGKTTLLMRTISGEFPQEYVPTVYDNNTSIFDWYGKRTISFWDTAGSYDYDILRPLSYPCANVVLLCFSVINISSFENVMTKWLPEIVHYCPRAVVVLVGTKVDLRSSPDMLATLRAKKLEFITGEEGEAMAKHNNCLLYIETSALTGHNLGRDFYDIMAKSSLLGLHLNNSPSVETEKRCILC